jgi:ubiquinone/menaquinone biosynthesis C-methylase UbiE
MQAATKPSPLDLDQVYTSRYGNPKTTGSLPRTWRRLRYHVPDTFYEATVAKLVHRGTKWLDVGCGRGIFPTNQPLAKSLVERCGMVMGIDPDATLEENAVIGRREKTTLEEFHSDTEFDLITLRMVAEHINRPKEAAAALSRLTAKGGKIVLYTVNRWSPLALAASLTPLKVHHAIKKAVWKCEEKDTFPVAYRMNTRKGLLSLFRSHGFKETYFAYLADCCIFHRFRYLHGAELLAWCTLGTIGLTYPENCLLAVFERV